MASVGMVGGSYHLYPTSQCDATKPDYKNLLLKRPKKRLDFKFGGSSSSCSKLETQNHGNPPVSVGLSLSLKFLHVHTLVG